MASWGGTTRYINLAQDFTDHDKVKPWTKFKLIIFFRRIWFIVAPRRFGRSFICPSTEHYLTLTSIANYIYNGLVLFYYDTIVHALNIN